MCHVAGCLKPASWRTRMEDVVLPLCIRHMELARDMGVKDEDIDSMPKREEA